MYQCWFRAVCSLIVLGCGMVATAQDDSGEPPAINPFGPRIQALPEAQPGFAEMSDGTRLTGQLYLTRDTRLKIYDVDLGRQREIPWNVIHRIDCRVEKEWLERQWRFKENANDQKVYTGHSYPARELAYTVTLQDGRTITGPVSGIVYVRTDSDQTARRVLLQKRQKGELDQALGELVYLRRVCLGEQAAGEPQPPRPEAPTKGNRQGK